MLLLEPDADTAAVNKDKIVNKYKYSNIYVFTVKVT